MLCQGPSDDGAMRKQELTGSQRLKLPFLDDQPPLCARENAGASVPKWTLVVSQPRVIRGLTSLETRRQVETAPGTV